MKNINELFIELKKIDGSLRSVLKESKFYEYDDLSGLDFDKADPEQRFLQEELRQALDCLEKADRIIKNLEAPIRYSGKLRKQSNGRYSLDGRELSSGYCIEVLAPCEYYDCKKDDYVEGREWVSTRIEHNGDDYYLVGYSKVKMDGLEARIR